MDQVDKENIKNIHVDPFDDENAFDEAPRSKRSADLEKPRKATKKKMTTKSFDLENVEFNKEKRPDLSTTTFHPEKHRLLTLFEAFNQLSTFLRISLKSKFFSFSLSFEKSVRDQTGMYSILYFTRDC